MSFNELGIHDASNDPADGLSLAPRLGSVLLSWFRPLSLVVVRKSVVDFETKEVEVIAETSGLVQPFTEEQLAILPEGERSWRWSMIHALPDLTLLTDDVVIYNGERLRVMGKLDYSDDGFVQYRAVNDYDRNNRLTRHE